MVFPIQVEYLEDHEGASRIYQRETISIEAVDLDVALRVARTEIEARGLFVAALNALSDHEVRALVRTAPPVSRRVDGWCYRGAPGAVRTSATDRASR